MIEDAELFSTNMDEEPQVKKYEDYSPEEKAADKALKACYEWWRLASENMRASGKYNTAVMWVQNNETGEMLVFTRGEYARQLKDAVEIL